VVIVLQGQVEINSNLKLQPSPHLGYYAIYAINRLFVK
jgi:hypothetical protein